jgi:hypothetical protein
MDTPTDFAAARPGASQRPDFALTRGSARPKPQRPKKAGSYQPIARCTIDTAMIARTVRPGDWAGPLAKNGEARAHRHTRRCPAAPIATAADGGPC